jgi:hypothetical protein
VDILGSLADRGEEVEKVRVARGRSVVSGLLVVRKRVEGDRRRVVNIWFIEREVGDT